MQSLIQDLRYGARQLLKKPGFTFVAVFTLALGIGANSAIFSLVNSLLLRPLPYADPSRLVMLAEKSREGQRLTVSYPNFADWRSRAQSFEGMASSRSQALNLTGVGTPVRLRGRTVNWSFFELLGVSPQLGRLFGEDDDRYGAARTAVLSDGLWKDKFGGDAGVIGDAILLDGDPYVVIGVLPPGFEYFRAADVYVPISLFLIPNSGLAYRGSSFGLYGVARLKKGVSLDQANSEMATLGTQLAEEYALVNSGKSAMAESLQDVMSEDVRSSLLVMLGAVGFVLLIACVNVANLLLVRAADRQREIAVRLALGAGPWRIFKQLLSESSLIAILGGLVGLLVGQWLLDGLLALAPQDIPQLNRVGLDQSVLLFTLGIAALTSMLCGVLPALHASRADLNIALKEGGRSTAGPSREGIHKVLLVAEVSMALVLLTGAGLLVRSMYKLVQVDPGFNTANLLTMRLNLSGETYNPQTCRVFYDECLTHVAALPGVRSAALTNSLPIDGSYWDSFFIAADKPVPPRADLPTSDYIVVSANYFETMDIRLLKGRLFTASDNAESPPVVIINETMGSRLWPGEDPIGKRVKQGFPESATPWREVVGIVNSVKLNGVERETSMETYLPLVQQPGASVALVVRTAGNPLTMPLAVEQAIHSIDKDLPVYSVLTMHQLLRNSLSQRRLLLVLLASFAILALLLAAIGIYGVIAYAVRRRTHEIGIRLALGAQVSDVMRLIVGQGMKLVGLSVALGLTGSWALTRLLTTLLFNVEPTDPLTIGAVIMLLTTVALLACWVPARRAAKVDPMVALRSE